RAHGQVNPVTAYKKEGFEMFDDMLNTIQEETVSVLMRVQVDKTPTRQKAPQLTVQQSGGSNTGDTPSKRPAQSKETQGRNELCACGSGLKYKNCHGK
ncbi:MAG: SEC-C metal-binding domain-containing protein, partial [Firmicutes bacterium]|nr:SEC-C metal-binding domain-containing protein [Bacillota bacterium]